MMKTESGSLRGGNTLDRAVKVAGALAESGIQRLLITQARMEQQVAARTVDLPSLLVPGVVIVCDVARIAIFDDRIDWSTASVELANALRAACGR